MSTVYDIILVIIFIAGIRRGWKRGLMSTLLYLLGWGVAALIIAGWAPGWAESLYGRFLEPWAIQKVEQAIPAGTVAAMNSGADALGSVQDVLDQLGGLLGGKTISAGDLSALQSLLHQNGSDLAQAIVQTIFRPALVAILKAVISVIILFVTMFVFRWLSRLAARRHRGLFGKADQILGAVLGAAEGWATGYIYAFALSILADLLTVSWLTPQILESTFLVRLLLS